MKQKTSSRIRLLLLLLLLPGCIPLKAPVLPAEMEARVLGRQEKVDLLCFSPDGKWLAAGGAGLVVYGEDGQKVRIADLQVAAMAWSLDSKSLDVAAATGDILTYRPTGEEVARRQGDGRVTAFFRREGRLQAIRAGIKQYRFGGNLKVSIEDVPGPAEEGRIQVLYDSTLPHRTAVWLEEHPGLLGRPVLNRGGDLLAFFQFKDPPAFPPSQELWVRHLASGRQWSLANLALPASGPAFSADGEALWVVDGDGLLQALDIWSGKVLGSEPVSNAVVAASHVGNRVFLGGFLQAGNWKNQMPAGVSVATFDPLGTRLAWVREGQVEIISRLPGEAAEKLIPAVEHRLRRLRDWRARDLIDDKEYRQQRSRILADG